MSTPLAHSRDHRDGLFVETYGADVLAIVDQWHKAVIVELQKDGLLPEGSIRRDMEGVVGGQQIKWWLEPIAQDGRVKLVWEVHYDERLSRSELKQKYGKHSRNLFPTEVAATLKSVSDGLISHAERKVQVRQEWDRRVSLLAELHKEFGGRMGCGGIGHNSRGLYFEARERFFLPLGKEREAIELLLKHQAEWEAMAASAPRHQDLMGYGLV